MQLYIFCILLPILQGHDTHGVPEKSSNYVNLIFFVYLKYSAYTQTDAGELAANAGCIPMIIGTLSTGLHTRNLHSSIETHAKYIA